MLSLTDTSDLKNRDYDRDSYDINKAAQDINKTSTNYE